MVANALQEHAEVKVVPSDSETAAVGEPRQCSVAYLHAVGSVEFAVAVCVAIEEVAEFRTLVGGEIVGVAVNQ